MIDGVVGPMEVCFSSFVFFLQNKKQGENEEVEGGVMDSGVEKKV